MIYNLIVRFETRGVAIGSGKGLNLYPGTPSAEEPLR